MQKVYIDTNVLVSYVSGPQKEPREYPKAKQIFDEIKQGKYIGVISTLTLIELQGVLRTLKGYERTILEAMQPNKQADYVKTEATNMYNTLMAELLKLQYIKFEKGRQTNFQSILDCAYQIMNDIKGIVKLYNNCGICNSNYKSSVHKQILVADILHALLAKDTNCDSLITFDKGFSALIGNSHIGSMQIIVQ